MSSNSDSNLENLGETALWTAVASCKMKQRDGVKRKAKGIKIGMCKNLIAV